MALPDVNLTISGALYGVLVAANIAKPSKQPEDSSDAPKSPAGTDLPQSWNEAPDDLREAVKGVTRFLLNYTRTTRLEKLDRDKASFALVDSLKGGALSSYRVPHRTFVEVFVSAKQVLA